MLEQGSGELKARRQDVRDLDVGGLAELKWIAEYADLHGIAMAPHGTANGILGLAALIQVCATLPDNFIAFEYPARFEPFWYDITEGFDGMPVKNGLIDVPDRPGLGLELIPEAAKKYLIEGDEEDPVLPSLEPQARVAREPLAVRPVLYVFQASKVASVVRSRGHL